METYYTPQEIAEMLKITIRSVYRYIDGGQLKAVKLGRVWRIAESEVQDLINRNMHKAGEPVEDPEEAGGEG